MCGALGVSRGGFHAWLKRLPSERSGTDELLSTEVRSNFIGGDDTGGARPVWHDLLANGVDCRLHRIERLMRQHGLKTLPHRRRLPPDLGERHTATVAPNVLDRAFVAEVPDRRWIADLTYFWTAEGWLYVAPVVALLAPCRRLVDERGDDRAARNGRAGDGDPASQ